MIYLLVIDCKTDLFKSVAYFHRKTLVTISIYNSMTI